MWTRASAENFLGGGERKKTRPKNCTIKSPSTYFISTMYENPGVHGLLSPAADAHGWGWGLRHAFKVSENAML